MQYCLHHLVCLSTMNFSNHWLSFEESYRRLLKVQPTLKSPSQNTEKYLNILNCATDSACLGMYQHQIIWVLVFSDYCNEAIHYANRISHNIARVKKTSLY